MAERDRKMTIGTRLLLVALVPPLLVAGVIYLALLPLYLILRWSYAVILRVWFELSCGAKGKRVILVYSRSPNWQEYIESNWLPRLMPHATIVNWSDRATWGGWPPIQVRLFRFYAGDRDFNPMVILLPGGRRVRTVRFYQAFRGFKHGKEGDLREAEAVLFGFVGGLKR